MASLLSGSLAGTLLVGVILFLIIGVVGLSTQMMWLVGIGAAIWLVTKK